MTLSVDLFWSVRSPYSWLSVDRIMKMSQDYELEVNVRQVYPIAIRNPEFFKKVDPRSIFLMHTQRSRTQKLGLF